MTELLISPTDTKMPALEEKESAALSRAEPARLQTWQTQQIQLQDTKPASRMWKMTKAFSEHRNPTQGGEFCPVGLLCEHQQRQIIHHQEGLFFCNKSKDSIKLMDFSDSTSFDLWPYLNGSNKTAEITILLFFFSLPKITNRKTTLTTIIQVWILIAEAVCWNLNNLINAKIVKQV